MGSTATLLVAENSLELRGIRVIDKDSSTSIVRLTLPFAHPRICTIAGMAGRRPLRIDEAAVLNLEQPYYTRREAALYLGVSARTVFRMINDGRILPTVNYGGSVGWLIPRDELVRLGSRRRTAA